jgi:hypothetical protein
VSQVIYTKLSFTDLSILVDAPEEVGWANEEILTHLRQHGEHTRECWVLDLLLEKV